MKLALRNKKLVSDKMGDFQFYKTEHCFASLFVPSVFINVPVEMEASALSPGLGL